VLINRNKMRTETENDGHATKKEKDKLCMLYPYNIRNMILYNTILHVAQNQEIVWKKLLQYKITTSEEFLFYNNILMWLQLVGAQVFANYRVEVHQMYGQSNVYLVLEYNQINVKLQDIFIIYWKSINIWYVRYLMNNMSHEVGQKLIYTKLHYPIWNECINQ